MKTTAAIVRTPGTPWEVTELALDEQAVVELTRGQLAEHAIITVGVLSAEVVAQAAAIVGKGGQVTVTSVGRSGDEQIRLTANGSVVGKLIRGVIVHEA